MFYKQVFVIHFLCYISTLNVQGTKAQEEEGDDCRAGRNLGICKPLNECPSAIQALQELRQNPVVCSFPRGSTLPLVCCVENDITKSKSYQKCVEYSQYNYEWVDVPPEYGMQKVRVRRCVRDVEPILIVGGTHTIPGEFPHMAALGYEDGSTIKWICGGSLISERFVLTAGHCTSTQEYGDVKRVRVGDWNLAEADDGANPQEFDIAEIIPHPEYKRPSRYNDIALLRINGKVALNPYIIPACLRWDPVITDIAAFATGWGRTSFDGGSSDILLKVFLQMFSQADCNASYAPLISERQLKFGIVEDTQLCAGHNTQAKDVCQGDSGGPLQLEQENDIYCMYSIIGVTSFGIGCGNIGTPGVYTRVSAYVPWIESIVWP